jgi:hypothetical protein
LIKDFHGQVYFESDEVLPCIVTCGGLCPGLNTVIRELVCGLYHMYNVTRVLGIEVISLFNYSLYLLYSIFLDSTLLSTSKFLERLFFLEIFASVVEFGNPFSYI